MYTSIQKAKKEVWKRWNDADLRRRVQEYVGEMPGALLAEPRAVVFRQVATPNFEFHRFSEVAQESALKALCLEYKLDKFCTRNPDKVLLGKMFFHNGSGKNIGEKVIREKVIDFATDNMKTFKEMKTIWEEGFISFHHRIMPRSLQHVEQCDNTSWFRKMGPKPSDYYHRFLAFFISHGILFENFLYEGDEGKFTREIVWPAIQKVTDYFGLKPLIVRLRPEESEADPYWCWYPGHLEAEVKALLDGGAAAARLHAQYEGANCV